MESYKQTKKKSTKRSKSLRKQLKLKSIDIKGRKKEDTEIEEEAEEEDDFDDDDEDDEEEDDEEKKELAGRCGKQHHEHTRYIQYIQYTIILMSYCHYLSILLFLFGRGVSSMTISFCLLLFLQFPLTGSSATEPCNLSEVVLSINCFTVGLSFRPPQARCLPKNSSTES